MAAITWTREMLTAGEFTFYSMADVDGQVAESIETDNQLSDYLSVC